MNDSANQTDQYAELRAALRALCAQYDSAYWQKVDEERGYPEAFVKALTDAGWLAALIPEQYGGSGLTLAEASVIMEEINRSGGNSGACHGQMYNMGTVLRHGSDAQNREYLLPVRPAPHLVAKTVDARLCATPGLLVPAAARREARARRRVHIPVNSLRC